VYRNNSRNVQVLNLNKKKETDDEVHQEKEMIKAIAGGGASHSKGECPDCSAALVFKEGCTECPECGWGKCEG
jgi:hypothetical protein